MRRALIILMLLTGCAAEETPAEKALEIERLKAEIRYYDQMYKDIKADNVAASKPSNVAKTKPTPKTTNVDDDEVITEVATGQKGGWCFKDYCPCEPNPYNNGIETFHCDTMEAGGEVTDELLAIGKGFRESRRQTAEFEARYPD